MHMISQHITPVSWLFHSRLIVQPCPSRRKLRTIPLSIRHLQTHHSYPWQRSKLAETQTLTTHGESQVITLWPSLLPLNFLTFRPDLISLVFSDVGSLTPEGVSQYLVGMFAGWRSLAGRWSLPCTYDLFFVQSLVRDVMKRFVFPVKARISLRFDGRSSTHLLVPLRMDSTELWPRSMQRCNKVTEEWITNDK
jgi:hypothetical protein